MVKCMGVASGCEVQSTMTIVESGWNVWGWLVCVVSRRWVWLEGVIVRRYIDFLILLIPTLLFIFKNIFLSCCGTFL